MTIRQNKTFLSIFLIIGLGFIFLFSPTPTRAETWTYSTGIRSSIDHKYVSPSFTINLNKQTYSPGEDIVISGSAWSGICNNHDISVRSYVQIDSKTYPGKMEYIYVWNNVMAVYNGTDIRKCSQSCRNSWCQAEFERLYTGRDEIVAIYGYFEPYTGWCKARVDEKTYIPTYSRLLYSGVNSTSGNITMKAPSTPGEHQLNIQNILDGRTADGGEHIAPFNPFVLGTETITFNVDSPYIDIGLRIWNGTEAVKVAAEPKGTVTSPLRIFKNNTVYGIALVNQGSSNGSKILIQTSSGVKELRKYTGTGTIVN